MRAHLIVRPQSFHSTLIQVGLSNTCQFFIGTYTLVWYAVLLSLSAQVLVKQYTFVFIVFCANYAFCCHILKHPYLHFNGATDAFCISGNKIYIWKTKCVCTQNLIICIFVVIGTTDSSLLRFIFPLDVWKLDLDIVLSCHPSCLTAQRLDEEEMYFTALVCGNPSIDSKLF